MMSLHSGPVPRGGYGTSNETPILSPITTERSQPTVLPSPTPTLVSATPISSPTCDPPTTGVELPPPPSVGFIEQSVRRIFSLFSNWYYFPIDPGSSRPYTHDERSV